MRLHVHAQSDVGRERAQIEDSLRVVQGEGFDALVVCDGMGGHEAGEVASAIATDRLIEALCANAPMRQALVDANQAVVGESRARGTPTMGTTAVCARHRTGRLEVGWVGDSRFYLFRQGAIVARSVDHSRVQRLVDLGFITPDQARNHPDSHVLVQALGGGPGAQEAFDPSDLRVESLERGDTLLLCSDGLYDMVEDRDLYPLMAERTPEDACQALIDAANARGGWDNITVIVACVGREQIPAAGPQSPSRAFAVSMGLLLLLGGVTAWKVLSAPPPAAAPLPGPSARSCDDAPSGMLCVPGGLSELDGPSCSGPGTPTELFVESFFVDTTEVTNDAYRRWCEADCSCDNSQEPDYAAPGQPAVGVPLERARAFCADQGKRLLRSEEFERAATRSGEGPVLCDEAVVADSSGPACGASTLTPGLEGRPDEVARRQASSFGVYDLLGNAPEWVEEGLLAGGDWTTPGSCLGPSERQPPQEGALAGFRCAADVEALLPPDLPAELPRVLTEPLAAELWQEPLPGSWGAKDPQYAEGHSYLGPQMVRDQVWALHRAHPDNTRVVLLADSRQGRPILALHIAQDPDQQQDKPSLLLNGAHHGHELLSVDYALDAGRWLLESEDVLAVRARSKLDVWLVPLVNPDGNFTTLHLDAGPKRGRKNGREVVQDCHFDPATEGVDLNRNYPFQWGGLGERGSSSETSSPYYRGPTEASEPETRALMALNDQHRFLAALSYHTNGSLLIAPYTIDGVPNPEPSMAWLLAQRLATLSPQPYRVVRSMYPVDGTDQDWHYHEHGTLAYIVEGSHHNPWDPEVRAQSREGVMPFLPGLVAEILDGLRIDGQVFADGKPVPAAISLVQEQTHAGEQWTARARDGRFYRLVPEPGTYRVIAEWGGERMEADVTVSRGAASVEISF